MAYNIGGTTGQANNANSSPVTISSDQVGSSLLATEESLILLRRLVKLLESNAVVDSGNRQRIIVDSLPTLASVTTVTTVSTVSNIGTIASQGSQQFADVARNAYANGIRSKLNFS